MLLVSIHVFGSDDLSSNPAGIVIIFLFLDKKMKTSVKEAVFHSQTKTVKVCEVGLDGIRTCDLSYLGQSSYRCTIIAHTIRPCQRLVIIWKQNRMHHSISDDNKVVLNCDQTRTLIQMGFFKIRGPFESRGQKFYYSLPVLRMIHSECVWCILRWLTVAVRKIRKFPISVEMQLSAAGECVKLTLCKSAL